MSHGIKLFKFSNTVKPLLTGSPWDQTSSWV